MSATVLVVDDLLPNVKLLEAKLNSEYYDVLTARSGSDAIKITQENPVDIILLDVMMPEMDGFETCIKLKTDPKTAHVPVVMVTALSETEDRIQGLKAGADDFLTKPVNDMALFARIRSLARIKIMIDELRLRDQTGTQFGIANGSIDPLNNISNAQIIIIDDDASQAKHMASKITESLQGSHVEIITEAEKAFDNIINNNYDLVIISTQIPDFDSLRLYSHIRSHERIRHLPVLILVEESDTKILIKGLDMGVNDYAIAPVEANELIARVITQLKRKRYQDALKTNYQLSINLAVTDGLTGLYNRRYFDAHCQTLIDEMTANNKPLCLMVTDIDHFKSVNDTYGHVVGDEILKQVAERITHTIRVTDLVARYGGEEFVIVLPSTTLENAAALAERIRHAIEATAFKISAGDGQLVKTTSIGLAALKPGDTPETLFKRADKGLYASKESGRNKVTKIEE